MTVLTIRKKPVANTRMNLGGIVPSRLAGLSSQEIAQIRISLDSKPVPLGDWWEVDVDGSDRLVIDGDCSHCDCIGGNMDGGILQVSGSAGDLLAEGMKAGRLTVLGDAGRFAGSGLRGVEVLIHGNAGEYAAGAKPGNSTGMRGGRLVIHGNCDRWLAARMRRGTAIVLGDVAGGAASRMIAGTLVLAADVQPPLGTGMRRGSILLLSDVESKRPQVLPGFTPAEECELSYLPLLFRSIASYLPVAFSPERVASLRVRRSLGDRANGGLGECLFFETAPHEPHQEAWTL